ncbi:MAG: KH domain-containing protein [Clostridiales bacterium]|jgi:spoIIIJ-associated protein|nr:KH domain-containing protein [Clostridiales bacterium]
MKSIEVKASSVEDAIARGLKELKVTREEVDAEVLSEGGFLKKTVVRLVLKESTAAVTEDNAQELSDAELFEAAIAEPVKTVKVVRPAEPGSKAAVAAEFIGEVLKKMKLDCAVTGNETDDGILLDVKGEDSGNVIGYRGETLDALQYLALLVANQGDGDFQKLVINAENYRAKREETLTSLANKLAVKAAKTGRRIVLEPMNPFERRVIHSALADSQLATTSSEGEEPNRYVVIVPKGDYVGYDDGGRRGGGGRSGGCNRNGGNRSGGYGNRDGGYNNNNRGANGGGKYNDDRGANRGDAGRSGGYGNRDGGYNNNNRGTNDGGEKRSGGRYNSGGYGGEHNDNRGASRDSGGRSGGYGNRDGGYDNNNRGTNDGGEKRPGGRYNNGGYGGEHNDNRGANRDSGGRSGGYERGGYNTRGTNGGYGNRDGGEHNDNRGSNRDGGGRSGGYERDGGYNNRGTNGGYGNRDGGGSGGYGKSENEGGYKKTGEYGDVSNDAEISADVKAKTEYDRARQYEVKEYGANDDDTNVTPVDTGFSGTSSSAPVKKGPPRFRSFK